MQLSKFIATTMLMQLVQADRVAYQAREKILCSKWSMTGSCFKLATISKNFLCGTILSAVSCFNSTGSEL